MTARDFSFELSRGSVPVGATRFVVTNAGVLPHDFAIAGRKTRLLKHGARATVIVRFHRARTYAYRSSLPGEAALGMRGVIFVGGPEPGPPPPPPPPTLYVDQRNLSCSDGGAGNPKQPFCTIAPAASRLTPGQTVVVLAGAYNETVTVLTSGAGGAPINFVAVPGGKVSVTGAATDHAYGFSVNGRHHVTIQGFDVTGTSADGIVVKSSSNITIRDNHVSYAGRPVRGELATGIRLEGTNDSVVARNTVDDNTNHGIYLESASTGNQIVGNRVFRNARVVERGAAGIGLVSSPGNTVSENISHNNEDSGIAFLLGSDNSLVCDNVVYDNGDHGIDNYGSTGQRIIANTLYKNATAGINVEAHSTGATIANNISVDNGIGSPRTHGDIRVESGSTSGTTLNYDLVYRSTRDTILVWSSVSYTSLAAFKSATGQEARGLQQNPRFRNAAGDDFHLTARSPAVDSANSGVSGQPSRDVEGNPRFDDPVVPNTGAGPRTFDDRGAYEFSRKRVKLR
ncbi:MAG: right-handed parallel beta-helix repeat-containing protein [Gaiellaceae bacterium]